MPALSDAVALPVAPPAAPAAAAAPEAPALPSPFLDVLEGAIPAVSLPPIQPGQAPSDVQEWTVSNFKALVDSGLGYVELADATSVFFNPKVINEKKIQEAEKSGTLGNLAPVVSQLGAPPAPAAAPAAPQEAPPAPPPPSNPAPGALAGVVASPQVPVSANRQQSRLRNVAPPAPNKPGQGPLTQLQRRAM